MLLGYADYTASDKLAAYFLFFGEFFIIIHGLGYTMNIYRAYRHKDQGTVFPETYNKQKGETPKVAILLAARHEPRGMLEEALSSIKNINYDNKEIFFLDDSSLEKHKKEVRELVEELGIHLFRREDRHGAKAGIINDCLKTLDYKYIAMFDADQNPMPEFLNKLIPLMENDRRLAFVQTPQFYTNIDDSRVAKAAAFQLSVFYEYICEGKSSQEAMFCCGTNILFRREALNEVGGLDEETVTKDFATSVKVHRKNWRSLYYSHVRAFGMAPQNLGSYFKQQYRWANGTISVLKKNIWAFSRDPFSLKPAQRWEYFLSGTYYIVGLAFSIIVLFPVFYLFFDIPSFFVRAEVYFLTFLSYLMLSMGVFYFVLKGRNYKVKDLFLEQPLGGITFPVYLKALLNAVLGKNPSFGITEKGVTSKIPYRTLWPQILFLFLNFSAVVWRINRFYYERELAILINSFWASFYFSLMCSIFYFNNPDGISSCKVLKKGLSFEHRVVSLGKKLVSLGSSAWKLCFSIFFEERLIGHRSYVPYRKSWWRDCDLRR